MAADAAARAAVRGSAYQSQSAGQKRANPGAVAVRQNPSADHRLSDGLGHARHHGIPGRASSRQARLAGGRGARAVARSVSAEMHSGFQALREHVRWISPPGRRKPSCRNSVAADVRRVVSIWQDCRTQFGAGGPFLFSEFSAADAMYAPVASRFRTYIPDLAGFGDDGVAQRYVDTLFAMPEMKDWEAGAHAQLAAG